MEIVSVVVMPIAVLALGFIIPDQMQRIRRDRFLAIIKRELEELTPEPRSLKADENWADLLTKKFLHEEIFEKVHENRDFILSLDANLAYDLKQMWTAFGKAKSGYEINVQGKRFLAHLKAACAHFEIAVDPRWDEAIGRQ